jgi:hypothetical protein
MLQHAIYKPMTKRHSSMEFEKINISAIRKKIDSEIGESTLSIPGVDKELVNEVLNSAQFGDYLQDQIYRWVIRAYFVNAQVQGYISERQMNAYLNQAKSAEGREQLAASILLSSVPGADNLPSFQYVRVEPEQVVEESVPHLSLVAR